MQNIRNEHATIKAMLTQGLKATGFLFCALLLASPGHAAVVGVDIASRAPLGDGASFGATGAYEEVRGTAHFAVDPALPANALIADIALAPRNAQGLVEFSADLVIWQPQNAAQGSGVTIVDIANRGGRVIQAFNRPTPEQPLGDGFLLREGYSVVWIGWEYDVAPTAEIGIDVPSVPDVPDSTLAGLGLLAVRDIGSWLRHAEDAPPRTEHLLAFGLSQSGRFLRTLLYHGMNSDEQGRQVFDGLLPHIAGASRLDINRRGAQPVGLGMFTATAYPFTDAALADAASGASEGLLDNARTRSNQPRIIYTDSSVEYWGGGRVAALTHLQPDASADIDLPANVRRYHFAGTQHGPATFPPQPSANTQLPGNPLDYWWLLRAALTNLRDWVVDGREPPASRYPRLADGTLVPLAQLQFPRLAGVHALDALDAGVRADNPLLPASGAGLPLPLLVPQVDADGNDIGGLRHPELVVPLATYTGWNFTHQQQGDPDTLFPLLGSYVPFAATAAARSTTNDPRRSVAERYRDKVDFLNQVDEAARELVSGRYLLPGDLGAVVQRASQHWDLVRGSAP
jgi:hypothetical protein